MGGGDGGSDLGFWECLQVSRPRSAPARDGRVSTRGWQSGFVFRAGGEGRRGSRRGCQVSGRYGRREREGGGGCELHARVLQSAAGGPLQRVRQRRGAGGADRVCVEKESREASLRRLWAAGVRGQPAAAVRPVPRDGAHGLLPSGGPPRG